MKIKIDFISGYGRLFAYSPIPIVGEIASWVEASYTIKEDELAILASGRELSSFNKNLRRIGEMSVDRLIGYLAVPVIYPESIGIVKEFVNNIIHYF